GGGRARRLVHAEGRVPRLGLRLAGEAALPSDRVDRPGGPKGVRPQGSNPAGTVPPVEVDAGAGPAAPGTAALSIAVAARPARAGLMERAAFLERVRHALAGVDGPDLPPTFPATPASGDKTSLPQRFLAELATVGAAGTSVARYEL